MPENYFGYEPMCEIKSEFNPSDAQLDQLSEFMAVEHQRTPAGYTYLGQFINHDISHDSGSKKLPWEDIAVSDIFNKRTPFLNLETIYGFERPSNEDEPARADLLAEGSRSLLRLGDTVSGAVKEAFVGKDLPRKPNSPEALIVDSRNDENLAVAQTQVAFVRFHNAVVKHLDLGDSPSAFEKARKIVIQHYQWIILKDYLPRIIKKSVLNEVLTEGNRFYFPKPKRPFIPLEFSVAALRAGHSMIRSTYNWNALFNDDPFSQASPATIYKLSEFTGRGGLGGRNRLVSDWLVNWNWFYETASAAQNQKFNFASPINTRIARLLGFLPDRRGQLPKEYNRENSLAALDLYRARAFRLPTGQEIARKILGFEDRVLKPEQIANLLPTKLKHDFSRETPFWFYLLAEAEIEEQGQTLGAVGSRIVAETFVELIKLSEYSILRRSYRPEPAFYYADEEEFGMTQMLKFIARTEGNQSADPLNPLENVR